MCYLIARKNGVKVEVFSIGFGKELFGFTDKNETRWKFSLIPLGGYVKMHGDLDEASTKQDDSSKIIPGQSFHEKTIYQRSMILVAGPAANFIFSFVLLIFINIFYGTSIDKPEISYVEKDMPAYNSGLKEGDLIIEIDGNKIEKFSQIKKFIENKNNQSINLLFSRDGKVSEVRVNVINNIIGIRGKIENKKLNFIESFNESLLQI